MRLKVDKLTHLIINETISSLGVGGCWRGVRSHRWTKLKILNKFSCVCYFKGLID